MNERKPSAPAGPQRYWGPWHFSRSRGMAREIDAIRRYIAVVTAALDREFAEFTEELGRRAEGAEEQNAEAISGETFDAVIVERLRAFLDQDAPG